MIVRSLRGVDDRNSRQWAGRDWGGKHTKYAHRYEASLSPPPAIKTIDDTAYRNCSSLTSVKFNDEIEEFVSCEALRGWWGHGVQERCLSTYCFLVRSSIPERFFGLAKINSWQVNTHDTLESIPIISAEGMMNVDTIDAKRTVYENLLTETSMLIPEQFGFDDGIVLNIL